AFAAIKDMKQLTSLRIDRSLYTDAGIADVGKLVGLESLSVEESSFGDGSLQALSALVNLKELNLTKTQITDAAFEYLLPFRDLEVLKVGANQSLRGQGLKELAARRALPKLRVLAVNNIPELQLMAYEGISRFKN